MTISPALTQTKDDKMFAFHHKNYAGLKSLILANFVQASINLYRKLINNQVLKFNVTVSSLKYIILFVNYPL
jgi:hypothetical protein